MFIVFKAYGKTSPTTYYGYSCWHDVKAGFLASLGNRVRTSGSDKFFALNGSNSDNIFVEELEVFEHEDDAWCRRNDYRAADEYAITGPTVLPILMANRVLQNHPERFADWKHAIELKKVKTARQALQLGRWTKEVMKGLLGKHKRDDVTRDLDYLTPAKFAAKYSL